MRDLVPAVSLSLFRRQLLHLRRSYRAVPLDELLAASNSRRRGGRLPVAITFDDDLPSHATIAMPELRRAGLPASFFVCGASLQAAFSYWWEDLQRYVDDGGDLAALGASEINELAATIEELPPSRRDEFGQMLKAKAPPAPADAGMRASDVSTLARAGFDIGFHTRGHYVLTGLSDEELVRELSTGRRDVEKAASRGVTAVAYPHGKADERVAAAARDGGYRFGLTCSGDPIGPTANPHLLGRVDASPDSLGRFALRLARTFARPTNPATA